ncbi:glycoside hydrolase family 16 protein [Microlunatus flavus]|uniref:Glycosyl hydrolases family 16 n=1 Tax=Microlunatus flavus TaxID=1036181 RepID=A0A1H8ZQE0_9ACTN|nr:glycoside hydrolase family 16 protein [Microlunatus flavus]SEP66670.1 Glycosyl hydrolases family 16 [Microlunatus flavus]
MASTGEARTAGGGGPRTIDERFVGGLDRRVWTDAYLPAWSSREAARASWSVGADGLHLGVPPEHPVWCPDLHEPRLRVSAVQSGNASGPLGSTQGQQPFREGLRVREAQPTTWGFTPFLGRVEVECRANVGPGSMFSAWMVGLEDVPRRSGEICLVEVFGETVRREDGRLVADVGSGVHAFRDPALHEDFVAPTTPLDVAAFHTYAVDWSPGRCVFSVDGTTTRVVEQAPDYPVQLILGVFDFPDEDPDPALVPELVVRRVTGRAPGA